MSLLKRLFAGDPRRDLERAEALLERGDAERALELVRRAEQRSLAADSSRARNLVERARDAVAAAALEKASLAEASEYFEDAAEWIEVALEHSDEKTRRRELEDMRRSLLERAREAEVEAEVWEPSIAPAADDSTQLDPGIHYQALIDMLAEDVGARYRGRPPAFCAAYVALNEGRVDLAREAFEILAAESEDPVVRLERGRCRLATGDGKGAGSDFESAWPAFGDDPLDLAGELSVPGLWSEAMLASDRPQPVIERLADLADPIAAAPLCERYAQALLAAERFDDAREFLASALARNSGRARFAYLLAEALEKLGERAAAIDCLEAAIAPSCVTGCAPRARHLPSFRALAALYLEAGSRPERVRELVTLVAQSLGGRLTRGDQLLLAGYYDQVGDAEAAEMARGHARRLGDDAAGSPATPPALGGRMRSPL